MKLLRLFPLSRAQRQTECVKPKMALVLMPATIPSVGFARIQGVYLPSTPRVSTFSCHHHSSPKFGRCRRRFGILAFINFISRRFDDLCSGRASNPSKRELCLAEGSFVIEGRNEWIAKKSDWARRRPFRFNFSAQCSHLLTTDRELYRSGSPGMKSHMESQTEVDAVPSSREGEETTVPEVEVSHFAVLSLH
jgi:hypothetical protein